MSHVVIYETENHKQCNEMRLVISAAGMNALVRASPGNHRWHLLVEERFAASAQEELIAYEQDQSEEAQQSRSQRKVAYPLLGGAVEGSLVYVFVLAICARFSWSEPNGEYWEQIGHMHAGSVLSGEWWRTITALTLHADFGHLFSNLIYGVLFGALATRVLGGGLAWFLILLGGGLGNFLNALLREAGHQSLGASTAVFAALGIIVALASRPSLQEGSTAMQRWSPIIAGTLLLAFLGIGGERTDVTAHFTGFIAGLACGGLASFLPRSVFQSQKVQWAATVATLGFLSLAWLLACQWTGVT